MFVTTPEFLPRHRQLLQIVSAAEARGQLRVVEMNQQVLADIVVATDVQVREPKVDRAKDNARFVAVAESGGVADRVGVGHPGVGAGWPVVPSAPGGEPPERFRADRCMPFAGPLGK
jgi:hypothetical protein